MKIIPFDPSVSSRQEFSVNLGELVCDFVVSWNSRAQCWYCDFSTSTGSNYSVRLVENSDLLGSVNATGLIGDFRVVRFNKSELDGITYDNFGSSWKLVYGSADEWKEVDDAVRT